MGRWGWGLSSGSAASHVLTHGMQKSLAKVKSCFVVSDPHELPRCGWRRWAWLLYVEPCFLPHLEQHRCSTELPFPQGIVIFFVGIPVNRRAELPEKCYKSILNPMLHSAYLCLKYVQQRTFLLLTGWFEQRTFPLMRLRTSIKVDSEQQKLSLDCYTLSGNP